MALIRKLFWVVVFVISTLCFIVLFEHGPENFSANFSKQFAEFRKMVDEQIHPPKNAEPPK